MNRSKSRHMLYRCIRVWDSCCGNRGIIDDLQRLAAKKYILLAVKEMEAQHCEDMALYVDSTNHSSFASSIRVAAHYKPIKWN